MKVLLLNDGPTASKVSRRMLIFSTGTSLLPIEAHDCTLLLREHRRLRGGTRAKRMH
jgi:hypothetical protein